MQVKALEYFRENLRAAMLMRGISQRELAEKAGMSYPFLNRVLVGKSEPTLPTCDRIADAMGVSVAELVGSPTAFSEVLLTSVII